MAMIPYEVAAVRTRSLATLVMIFYLVRLRMTVSVVGPAMIMATEDPTPIPAPKLRSNLIARIKE
jgi:hypothetical protein